MTMPHPSLAVLGYSQAAMFLRSARGSEVVGIISIHGAREFAVESDVGRRLDLRFDDVEVPEENDIVSKLKAKSRRRWAAENGLVEIAPTESDAAAIIDFALKLGGAEGILLCHCSAGMSRAPAAALICLAAWQGQGTERKCVAELMRVRPAAVPHQGLVRFADRMLKRKGQLTQALAERFKG